MERKENWGVVKMQDWLNVSHTFGKLVNSGLHLALDPQDDSCCLPCVFQVSPQWHQHSELLDTNKVKAAAFAPAGFTSGSIIFFS